MSKIKEKFNDNNFIKLYRGDFEFRTIFNTLMSSSVTAAIATYDLVVAILERGVWLFTIAVYYYVLITAKIAILVSHRIGVLKKEDEKTNRLRDAKNYLSGGGLIVILTLAFTGIIVLVTVKNYHFDYPGMMIYVMAAYAFWKITMSLINGFKYKKHGDLTVQTFRNINIVDGIMSVIALQSALLYTFSSESEVTFASTMNAAIGGIADTLILALGTYMIIRGNAEIVKAKKGLM